MDDWYYTEALKSIFPLLEGSDLVSCMLVCRQWRDVAKDDYFWKCICTQKWPSIAKKPLSNTTYHRLFSTFSKPPRQQPLPFPRLSFEDLSFYIDIWSDETLIFSQAASGSVLRTGLKTIPNEISERLKSHLEGPDCTMVLPVDPRLAVSSGPTVTASILVNRNDSNKMACVVNKSVFDYVDVTASRALSYEYLRFSPRRPFVSDIRAWVSLLFVKGESVDLLEVFGVEIDFCDAATKENEVLWLLDMLDWK
ncbi:hypothetical protein LUZ60_006485 [Juncus effusus]|nr:hypothetical protein LUZ60_006485 [Juncus effusus]